MKLAVNEAIASSRAKEDSMRCTQTKVQLEKKYAKKMGQAQYEKELRIKAEDQLQDLQD